MMNEYNNYIPNETKIPFLFETYRSHILQTTYYNIKRSTIKGGNILSAGMHHFGIATDIVCLTDKNQNGLRDPKEPVDWESIDYLFMRKLAKEVDVYDLGKYETCHFQLIPTFEQQHLRIVVKNAVIKFQTEHGLVPDGIVGNKTITKAKEIFL
jgi:hypothetical protein